MWPVPSSRAELGALKVIDLSNNPASVPPTTLLKLPKLRRMKGVRWNGSRCGRCELVRNYTAQAGGKSNAEINIRVEMLKKGKYFVGKKIHCRGKEHQISDVVQMFAMQGFFPTCLENNQKCFQAEVRVTPVHRCWEVDNLILNIEYVVAPTALVLNAMVILTTLTTPAIRKKVSMLLATNMALSDFAVSCYTLMIVSFRKMAYLEFLGIMGVLCQVLGSMWLMGSLVTAITSLLLTMERYLVIVYVNPDRHMRTKHAMRLMVTSWLVAAAAAVLPSAACNVGTYTGNTYCIPIHPSKEVPYSFSLSIGLVSTGICLYISTIPCYVRIYKYVCRSRLTIIRTASSPQSKNIKKEGTVAKKIAIVVMTNLFFFLLPVFIALIWLVTDLEDHMTPVSKEILTGVVPTICFSLNALLNPLLYAFRNKTFQNALKKKLNIPYGKKRRSSSESSTRPRGRTVSSLMMNVFEEYGNGLGYSFKNTAFSRKEDGENIKSPPQTRH